MNIIIITRLSWSTQTSRTSRSLEPCSQQLGKGLANRKNELKLAMEASVGRVGRHCDAILRVDRLSQNLGPLL